MAISEGQVQFEVRASGLDEVLKKAQSLQSVLQSINGRVFNVAFGQAAQTMQKVGKMTADEARAFKAATDKEYKTTLATAKVMEAETKKESAAVKDRLDATKTEVDMRLKAEKAETDMANSRMKTEDSHYKTYHEEARKDQAAADKHEGFVREQARKDEAEADVHMRTVGQESRDAVAAFDKHQSTVNKERRADVKADDAHRKSQQDYEKGQRKIQNDQRAADDKDMLDHLKALKLSQSIQQAQRTPAEQAQQKMENDLVRFGARMQTLGATLQNITSPFMNVYRGIAMGAGYRLLGTFTNSIQGAFKRFDVMKMYPKMMEEYETKNYTAKQSVDELDKSVRGLPTGLGEITEMAQRYTLSLGDMKRGTRLAIASNRAFLASMATETQRYQGMLQLQDLMNGKELQPREWMSLGASMGKAINEIAVVMGAETQEDIRNFRKQLYAGKVDTEAFLDALEKVGNKGGAIYKKANVYKNTIEALQRNINNAFERMGEHMLTTLDEIARALTGKGLVRNLKGITKWIDELGESAQKWMKANPDKIKEFFDMLKDIDWSGTLSGFAQMGGYLAKFYGGMLKVFGGSDLVKWMVNINMLGKVIQGVGGLTKGLAGPISKLLTGTFLGGLGNKAIKASTIGKNMRSITGATKYMSKTVLAMKKVELANKGLNILGFLSIAASVKLGASALKDLSDVDIDWPRFFKNMGQMAIAIGEFGVAAMALSPKGPITGALSLTRFLGEAEIGAIALDMIAMAKAMDSISKVDVPDRAKIRKVLNSVADFVDALPSTDMFTALGKFFSSTAVTSASKAVSSVTSAINSVNDIKGSLKKFRKAMFGTRLRNGNGGGAWGDDNSIVGIMQDMLAQFDNNPLLKTLAERWKGSNIASVFSSLASMMTDFQSIANKKIDEEQITKATNNITALSGAIKPLLSAFNKMYSAEFGTKSGDGKTLAERKGMGAASKSFSSSYGAQASGFAKMMEYLNTTLKFTGRIINKLNGMKGKMEELQKNFGGEGGLDFSALGNIMGSLTKMLDESGVTAGDYSLAPENMEYVNEAMGMLKRVVNKMMAIKEQITELTQGGEGGFVDIGAQIGTIISDLIGAVERVPQLESGASMLLSAMGMLKKSMKRLSTVSGNYTAQISEIKNAIDQLSALGSQTITISLTINANINNNVPAAVAQAATAILNALKLILPKYEKTVDVEIKLGKHIDTVSPFIMSVASRIRRAFNSIPSTLNKTVTMNIRRQRNEIAMSTGGKVGHKVQYRAHGGSIFRPRGTDTIPAMLTEGEYVMNHMSANAIGYDTLQRLNHLDIIGAIRGLSAKVGHSISTINNTKNANVTVNNYNAPSVGFAKASRWVAQL